MYNAIQSSTNAARIITYVLQGDGSKEHRCEYASGIGCSVRSAVRDFEDTRDEFDPHRHLKIEAYSEVMSASREEFDPDDGEQVHQFHLLAVEAARRQFPGRQVLVGTQIDGKTGLCHAHIVVSNIAHENASMTHTVSGHPATERVVAGKPFTSAMSNVFRIRAVANEVLADESFMASIGYENRRLGEFMSDRVGSDGTSFYGLIGRHAYDNQELVRASRNSGQWLVDLKDRIVTARDRAVDEDSFKELLTEDGSVVLNQRGQRKTWSYTYTDADGKTRTSRAGSKRLHANDFSREAIVSAIQTRQDALEQEPPAGPAKVTYPASLNFVSSGKPAADTAAKITADADAARKRAADNRAEFEAILAQISKITDDDLSFLDKVDVPGRKSRKATPHAQSAGQDNSDDTKKTTDHEHQTKDDDMSRGTKTLNIPGRKLNDTVPVEPRQDQSPHFDMARYEERAQHAKALSRTVASARPKSAAGAVIHLVITLWLHRQQVQAEIDLAEARAVHQSRVDQAAATRINGALADLPEPTMPSLSSVDGVPAMLDVCKAGRRELRDRLETLQKLERDLARDDAGHSSGATQQLRHDIKRAQAGVHLYDKAVRASEKAGWDLENEKKTVDLDVVIDAAGDLHAWSVDDPAYAKQARDEMHREVDLEVIRINIERAHAREGKQRVGRDRPAPRQPRQPRQARLSGDQLHDVELVVCVSPKADEKGSRWIDVQIREGQAEGGSSLQVIKTSNGTSIAGARYSASQYEELLQAAGDDIIASPSGHQTFSVTANLMPSTRNRGSLLVNTKTASVGQPLPVDIQARQLAAEQQSREHAQWQAAAPKYETQAEKSAEKSAEPSPGA